MSKVSIVKCDNYEQDEVDRAVRESVELAGGMRGIVNPGDKVILKVNVLNADVPEKAVTTHPAIAKAVIRLVKKAGGIPFLGDAPGIAYTYEDAREAWQATGLKKAAEEEGVEIVNFKQVKEIKTSVNKRVPVLHIAKDVMDADAVISLPKLKTHSFTLFTGAIKNLYGTIPGFRKKELHALAPKPEAFAELVVDILAAVKPKLAVMDAIVGMEGFGPAAGSPRRIGLVMASKDMVAVDAVASYIIGYNPLDVEITRVAYERGFGEARIEKLDIRGEKLEEVKLEDFQLINNLNTFLKRVPSFILFLARVAAPLFLKVEPQVNRENCVACGVCVKHCPTKAIKFASSIPKIQRKKCIKCFCCQEFCPEKAIIIKYNWLAKKLKM
ncbi:DUF362 domain-containing protein [Candidatus Aerophobetes bacterium]|nr:DUF362 domain-containing protein [Candidatus Aerophobetes bacterium]